MPSRSATKNKPRKNASRSRGSLVITLGGLAGSGKSTAAAALTKKFKLRHVSAGDMFRAIAKERKMDLIQLGRYAERHPKFDEELDKRMLAEARKGGVILDGRATAFLTKKSRIPALRIFLMVDPKVSANRVAMRDGISVAKALKSSQIREREIARRLKTLYGLDTKDTSAYDAVIETDGYSVQEVVNLIIQLVKYGRN